MLTNLNKTNFTFSKNLLTSKPATKLRPTSWNPPTSWRHLHKARSVLSLQAYAEQTPLRHLLARSSASLQPPPPSLLTRTTLTSVFPCPNQLLGLPSSMPSPSLNSDRKRRWDQPQHGTTDPALAAAAVAEQLTRQRTHSPVADPGHIREFEINDHPGRRFAMMSATIKSIESKTGVLIVSKGRYYPPNTSPPPKDADDANRKLFLKIRGVSQEAVEAAISAINDAMNGGTQRDSERVWCDMDASVAPQFRLLERLRGIDNEYVNWIEKETGVKLSLAGKGTGDDSRDNLHFSIRANGGHISAAKSMCFSLVRAIQPVYNDYVLKYYGIRPRRSLTRVHLRPRQRFPDQSMQPFPQGHLPHHQSAAPQPHFAHPPLQSYPGHPQPAYAGMPQYPYPNPHMPPPPIPQNGMPPPPPNAITPPGAVMPPQQPHLPYPPHMGPTQPHMNAPPHILPGGMPPPHAMGAEGPPPPPPPPSSGYDGIPPQNGLHIPGTGTDAPPPDAAGVHILDDAPPPPPPDMQWAQGQMPIMGASVGSAPDGSMPPPLPPPPPPPPTQ